MHNNVVPACMLYVAADVMHGVVTPVPFVKCTTASELKIKTCLLEYRWY